MYQKHNHNKTKNNKTPKTEGYCDARQLLIPPVTIELTSPQLFVFGEGCAYSMVSNIYISYHSINKQLLRAFGDDLFVAADSYQHFAIVMDQYIAWFI